MMMNTKKWKNILAILIIIIVGIFLSQKNKTIENKGSQLAISDHYSDNIDRYDPSDYDEEELYRLQRQDAPFDTYPQETQDFILQKGYLPGYFFVQLNDNETQLIQTRNKDETRKSRKEKNNKNYQNETTNIQTEIEEFLSILNERYQITLIDRPEIQNHTPEKTGIYRNNYYRIKFNKRNNSKEIQADTLYEEIQNFPHAKHINANRVYQPSQAAADPNDPKLSAGQWYLSQIDASEGWNAVKNTEGDMPSPGEGSAKIGLIDNGTLKTHEDLQGNAIWHPGIVNGGHGTHTAGSVAADTNNGVGVPAVSYNFAKMPTAGGGLSEYNTKGRSDWAVSQGAIAVSRSRGCPASKTQGEGTRSNWIQQRSSTLFIIAAGNDNRDPRTQSSQGMRCGYQSIGNYPAGDRGFYPASVESSNVLTVGASTTNDNKASFSNYGGWVEVSAPGTAIRSTASPSGGECTNGSYYYDCQGTSMATPVVASLAGLLAGSPKGQSLDVQSLKNTIIDTADSISRPGGGRINVCNAVDAIGYPCPFPAESDCSDGSDNNGDGNTDCDDPTCGVTTVIDDVNTCGSSVTLDATTNGASSYSRQPGGETTSSITVSPTQTTTYTVDIQKSNGCSKILEVTVNVTDPEPEQCSDNIDNDCNGQTDCQDSACSSSSACSGGPPTPPGDGGGVQLRAEICNNVGCDRDSDGETNCLDGEDNDGNGEVDCQDSNCKCLEICGGYTCNGSDTCECNCCDGIDNNGDGNIDCLEEGQPGLNGIPSQGKDPSCQCDEIGSLEHTNQQIYNIVPTSPEDFQY